MTQQLCMRCSISGTVQGVFYRASARDQANKYGIKGWAKNLPDGRVEVVACGTKEHLDLFFTWLKQGPKQANVTEASREDVPWCDYEQFLVL